MWRIHLIIGQQHATSKIYLFPANSVLSHTFNIYINITSVEKLEITCQNNCLKSKKKWNYKSSIGNNKHTIDNMQESTDLYLSVINIHYGRKCDMFTIQLKFNYICLCVLHNLFCYSCSNNLLKLCMKFW